MTQIELALDLTFVKNPPEFKIKMDDTVISHFKRDESYKETCSQDATGQYITTEHFYFDLDLTDGDHTITVDWFNKTIDDTIIDNTGDIVGDMMVEFTEARVPAGALEAIIIDGIPVQQTIYESVINTTDGMTYNATTMNHNGTMSFTFSNPFWRALSVKLEAETHAEELPAEYDLSTAILTKEPVAEMQSYNVHVPENYPAYVRSFFNEDNGLQYDYKANIKNLPRDLTADEILFKAGLPYLELDIDFDNAPIKQEILDHEADAESWREQWDHIDEHAVYQTRDWVSYVMYGPKPWDKFAEESKDQFQYVDEDHRAKMFKDNPDYEFEWDLPTDSAVRNFVNDHLVDDKDLYLCYILGLSPEGYLFPHVDHPAGRQGLTKCYFATTYPEGSYFKFYDKGFLPFTEGKIMMINPYVGAHGVINMNKEHARLPINIAMNLESPRLQSLVEASYRKIWDEINN